MSLKAFKLLLLSSLGLSLLLTNSQVMAQTGDSVVVPTTGSSSSTTSNGTYGNTSTQTGNGTYSNTSTQTNSSTVDSGRRFTCQYYNGQYVVMYQPESQPGQFFPWASPQTLGGGWDTQKRCDTIAQRLESYRPDGLVELQTAVENRQNIVCVTTEAKPFCRIVLTVPPGKDPNTVRNSVFQNLASADNGQQTTAVNTYGSRGNDTSELYNLGRTLLGGSKNPVSTSKSGINLKAFLDPKDGGTGRGMRNGVAIRRQTTKPQANTTNTTRTLLNPSKFRRP
jgi:Circadian oscillating protein COP23